MIVSCYEHTSRPRATMCVHHVRATAGNSITTRKSRGVPGRDMAGFASASHELQAHVGDAVRCRDALTEGVVAGTYVCKNTHESVHKEPSDT